jgi:MFS family permease
MSEAAPTRSALPFFLSSFSWNFALGMTYPLVPLYAHQLGMSGVGIGSLVALPVVVQISFNLIGGAYTDQVGGRSLMLASFVLTAGAGSVFFFAGGFAFLWGLALIPMHRWAFAKPDTKPGTKTDA